MTVPCNFLPGVAIVDLGGIRPDFAQDVPDILEGKGNTVLQKGEIRGEGPGNLTSSKIDLVVEFAERPAEVVESRDGQGDGLQKILVEFSEAAEDLSNFQSASGLLGE